MLEGNKVLRVGSMSGGGHAHPIAVCDPSDFSTRACTRAAWKLGRREGWGTEGKSPIPQAGHHILFREDKGKSIRWGAKGVNWWAKTTQSMHSGEKPVTPV